MRRGLALLGMAAVLLSLSPVAAKRPAPSTIVFNGEDNRLNAYEVSGKRVVKQTVIPSAEDAPKRGLDLNAQICFFPDGSRRFVAGEDTGQGRTGHPGWGIFKLKGDRIGRLSATEGGKLTPTYQTSDNESERGPLEDNPENYGCGFLRNGRIVTTDVGNQIPGNSGNGQLIVWFPPFNSFRVRYCKIDITIATAQGIYVGRDDGVYVASARPGLPPNVDGGVIFRYDGKRFPTSNRASGGCGGKDETGAPMANPDRVSRSVFIRDPQNATTPNAIVPSGHGTFYVSSVFTGVISEFDRTGGFMRRVLEPPPGEFLAPFSTGSPIGLGVDRKGTLYYADLGLVLGPPPGPGDHTGTVRRIRFVSGEPQVPEQLDDKLNFPDGIGVLELPR
jgi:hypothetical protein